MAKYGRLRCKVGEEFVDFFPKSYASLIVSKSISNDTVEKILEDFLNGNRKVSKAKNADNSSNSDNATNSEKVGGYHIVVREKGYSPSQGNYIDTIVFIRQS